MVSTLFGILLTLVSANANVATINHEGFEDRSGVVTATTDDGRRYSNPNVRSGGIEYRLVYCLPNGLCAEPDGAKAYITVEPIPSLTSPFLAVGMSE